MSTPKNLTTPGWADEATADTEIDVKRLTRPSRIPTLKQVTGPGAPRDCACNVARVIIGRAWDADFTVEAPELSRHHIAVEFDGQEHRCVDLDSLHGLYLNGVKVHSCVLRTGDAIQIGNVTFIFDEGSR